MVVPRQTRRPAAAGQARTDREAATQMAGRDPLTTDWRSRWSGDHGCTVSASFVQRIERRATSP